jgi:chromosome segregation ATPase
MKWLILAMMLAQTPEEEVGFGGGVSDPEAASTSPDVQEELARTTLELQSLRARVQQLEAQVQQSQQQATQRLTGLEQQQGAQQERALRLEQLRQQRVEALERAFDWLVLSDQQLQTGELDIGPSLTSASLALSEALEASAEAGQGQSEGLISRAQERLGAALRAAQERDSYLARVELDAAGFELREAWRLSLNRSGASALNP